MAAAVANYASEPASFYQGFILYVPQPGSQSELGTAQFFLGYHDETPNIPPDVLPEPSSLILLGSGLLGIAGFLWRRRHSA
jgi:predicted Zn-dependent peptidase